MTVFSQPGHVHRDSSGYLLTATTAAPYEEDIDPDDVIEPATIIALTGPDHEAELVALLRAVTPQTPEAIARALLARKGTR